MQKIMTSTAQNTKITKIPCKIPDGLEAVEPHP